MSLTDTIKSAVSSCRRRPRTCIAAVLVALVALLGFALTRDGSSEVRRFHEVERGRFLVSVVEGGSLQAVEEVVVRNELEGSSRIIYIIPEGTVVKKGDLLVELDSGEADDALNQQKINYEKSLADFVAAENSVVITKSTVESNTRAAQLAAQFADMDLKKFEQIDREQQIRSADIAIIKAKEELEIAQETLTNTKKLEARGFETKNKLDQDRLSVTNKTLALEEAESSLTMLKKYDLEKLKATFNSSYEEALQELERVEKQGQSLIAQAQADLSSAENTLELNKSKLEKMTAQFSATKIYAPQDGFVVYAIGESRYSSESMIEEGATVRMRQELIKIPDTSSMKVIIKVHESQIGQIEIGQPAFVVLDSMPDERFRGEVKKVAVLPNAQSRWGNPNLKVYSTEIVLTDRLPDSVKPGVSARAEVVITQLPDALTVPIQSVTTLNGNMVCYVDKLGGPQPVSVEIGLYNNNFIEVTSGLAVGDRVLIAPPVSADTDLSGGVLAGNEEDLDLPSERPQPKESKPSGPAKSTGNPPGGSPSEEQRAAMMKRFDKDGDGKLSDEEKAAMRSSLGGAGGGGTRGGGGGPREDGGKREGGGGARGKGGPKTP